MIKKERKNVEDHVEMVLGVPVLHTRSEVTGEKISINKPGYSPVSSMMGEENRKQILEGRYDNAVALRAEFLRRRGSLDKTIAEALTDLEKIGKKLI